MTAILSTTAASVKIQKLPEHTKYVTYKIYAGEISFYYWMQDIVCKFNFHDPEKRQEFDSRSDFRFEHLYGHNWAYMPCNTRNLSSTLEEVKKHNLQNIVFDCVSIVRMSTLSSTFGNLADGIKFYGSSFELSDDQKNLKATTRHRLPNTSGGIPCWGNRNDIAGRYGETNIYDLNGPNVTIHGKINTFIKTTFNNDYVPLGSWVAAIAADKNADKSTSNNFSSTLLTSEAFDAFLTISFKTHSVAYFRLSSAGFKPVGTTNIMLLPLKAGSVTHEGTEYYGYFTQEDSLGKKWFVNDSGHLLGQVDD